MSTDDALMILTRKTSRRRLAEPSCRRYPYGRHCYDWRRELATPGE